MSSLRRMVAIGAILGLALLWGACGNDSPPPAPSSIEFVQEVGDTSLPGVERPVRARVADAGGNAVSGVSVDFAPVLGSGTASPATALTDDVGIARATWTLGPEEGTPQKLEARVLGFVPAVLVVDVAPLFFNATDLAVEARQVNECDYDSLTILIPGPACSQPLSELKLEIRGTVTTSGMGGAHGTLRCANLEVPLEPLLHGASTVVTLLWFGGEDAVMCIDGGICETASIFIYSNILESSVYLNASACGVDNFAWGDIRVAEISFWGD